MRFAKEQRVTAPGMDAVAWLNRQIELTLATIKLLDARVADLALHEDLRKTHLSVEVGGDIYTFPNGDQNDLLDAALSVQLNNHSAAIFARARLWMLERVQEHKRHLALLKGKPGLPAGSFRHVETRTFRADELVPLGDEVHFGKPA